MISQSPLLRQWLLLRLLSVRRPGLTLREIARETCVSVKTVRRDLHTLRAVGWPVEEVRCEYGRKRWRLAPQAAELGISFTLDEALALYLGRRFLEPLAGTYFWDASHRAFQKIRATLGHNTLLYLERMAKYLLQTNVGVSDYSTKGELIDRLMIAIEDRRVARITYRSLRATEPVEYEVHPLGIVFHRRSLYLVAHSVSHSSVRHFKMDRLEDVMLQDQLFNGYADFDLQSHLSRSFGIFHADDTPVKVRVRFSPTAARYVQELRWHPSQQLRPLNDGSLLFEVEVADTTELKAWVLSFGKQAEVISPPQLRDEIREEVGQMAHLYADRSARKDNRQLTTARPH
jgi:predicted DNA-binding transcriptional regulator YafY